MRILVAEDDDHVARAVERGLEAEGYAVDVALNGTDGHWLAYDLIVSDSIFSGLSGEAVCTAPNCARERTGPPS